MFFKKSDFYPVIAPISGKVIALTDLEDPIFSGKVVGDGVAIIPGEGEAVAPVSGVITMIAPTNHSYGITAYDGTEVLVHIGIDTVKLNGKGFTPLVKKGDSVDVGQPICKFDLEGIRAEGFNATTPVIITSNSIDKVKRLTLRTGFAEAGKTACMMYALDKK